MLKDPRNELALSLVLLVAVLATGAAFARSKALFLPLGGRALWRKSLDSFVTQDPRSGLRHLRELLRQDPENPVYLSLQADAHEELGEWLASAQAGEKLLRSTRPDMACHHLTLSYEKLKQYGKALEAYERCRELEPENPTGLYNFAMFLERRGKLDRAAALYTELAASPSFIGARLALARVRLLQNKPLEAEAVVAAVLKRSPGLPAALSMGAATARALGRPGLRRKRLQAFQRSQERPRSGLPPFMGLEGTLE